MTHKRTPITIAPDDPITQGLYGGMATTPARNQMPLVGVIAEPFPLPALPVLNALKALQPNLSEVRAETREPDPRPRPWDPASCPPQLRRHVWQWLGQVAVWVNEQHLWDLRRPGIPGCWPAHPHIAHDLAAVACARYLAADRLTPAALEEWHRHTLPMFLDRLDDRLGDGCVHHHQPAPRQARDRVISSRPWREGRQQRVDSDLQRTD